MFFRRVHFSIIALGAALALGGCETFDLESIWSTKKPLPGERRTVFPDGVPGVQQGVPPELVQGYQPQPELEPAPVVVPEKPKPKPRRVAAPKPAAAPPAQPQQQAPAQQQPAQAPWPSQPQAAPQPQPSVWPEPPRR
jgi:hypothetical protein